MSLPVTIAALGRLMLTAGDPAPLAAHLSQHGASNPSWWRTTLTASRPKFLVQCPERSARLESSLNFLARHACSEPTVLALFLVLVTGPTGEKAMATSLPTLHQLGPTQISIRGNVYELGKFLSLHPGGRAILEANLGKDCTEQFELYHNPSVLAKYHSKLCVGVMAASPQAAAKRASPFVPAAAFGDQIPFGDPTWYQRFPATTSMYYQQSHLELRRRVRSFVDTQVLPGMAKWENKARPPPELLQKMGKEGLLACMVYPHPTEYVDAGTYIPIGFDHFHCLIVFDEVARIGNGAVVAALTNGPAIATSAIIKSTLLPEHVKRRVLGDVFMGRKMIALACSEPNAGSDVANLQTTIVDVGDGKHFRLRGLKKWITNGTYADFFTTLVKDPEAGGLSMLVVDAKSPGLTVRKVNIYDNSVGGTAYLDFVDVLVPKEHLLGKRGKGFKMQMLAFNFERFYLAVLTLRSARCCIEELVKYAAKRKTFGKTLDGHQSIRLRIAAMVREVEACWAWTEALCYQMQHLPPRAAAIQLGDLLGSLKVQASVVYERVALSATHVGGGNMLMRGGPLGKVSSALMATKGYAIPGGAADVLDDYTARTLFRRYRANL